MNVIEMLQAEICDKPWAIEEKARYIYIRSCQLFSYDERYWLTLLSSNDALEERIRTRTVDLTNVTDFEVLCAPYARLISDLLSILLKAKCEIVMSTEHAYTILYINDKIIKIDGTWSDIWRVKMNLSTNDYTLMSEMQDFKSYLRDIDIKTGYIKDNYQDEHIAQKRLFLDTLEGSMQFSDDEFLLYRLATIKEMYDTFNAMNSFSDARSCIEYLKRKLIPNNKHNQIKENTFFKERENEWEIMRLYVVDLSQALACFALKRANDRYSFNEIPEEEAKYYSRILTCKNK
ncbi:MAG: hypothetical protein K2J20_01270, partial [Bacilli bacterium]|nr:hypothetical protein [Bacilli bacterium]